MNNIKVTILLVLYCSATWAGGLPLVLCQGADHVEIEMTHPVCDESHHVHHDHHGLFEDEASMASHIEADHQVHQSHCQDTEISMAHVALRKAVAHDMVLTTNLIGLLLLNDVATLTMQSQNNKCIYLHPPQFQSESICHLSSVILIN